MRKTSPSPSVYLPRHPRGFLPLLLWLMVIASPSFAQESAPGVSILNFTNWKAVAYSHQAGGTLCWLIGPDGSLRLEVKRGAEFISGFQSPLDAPWPRELEPLLDRAGEGWTVVLGPDDTGTLNAWGREWRSPPTGVVQMIRLVTRALESHPDLPGPVPFAAFLGTYRDPGAIPRPTLDGHRAMAAGPRGKLRYELAPLDLEETSDVAGGGFRARMASRGRGTGGVGEIVTLTWLSGSDRPESRVKISSSRRPGTLVLEAPAKRQVDSPPPELFLPIWPLSQFF